MTNYLLICIDGCSPDYLRHADTPTLDELMAGGLYREVKAMVPTVTNVNNVSIVTGVYPETHGITANYYRDRRTGQAVYMETADFLLGETVFEWCRHRGMSSAVLTVKDKLRTLLTRGASLSISAEKPPAWWIDRLGPPPDVYSLEVNHWLMAALGVLMEEKSTPDFIYLATTDYAMHKFSPENERAIWHLSRLDRLLGEALGKVNGEMSIAVTADHGMNAKSRAVDLGKVLARAGISAEAIPIIKDRYVEHHQNMGGAAYIYLENEVHITEAIAVLEDAPGVEHVMTAEEGAKRYHLHPSRIGDLLVLADTTSVFGTLDTHQAPIALRSHGSLHERTVPLIFYGNRTRADSMLENKDAVSSMMNSF
jgi:phosphonoacetate hydrolase